MKKFLSLVLALAMTLSLVTISAGAKDFTDSDELSGEQYAEAVNVMSEMGIIDGYADGDFRPDGTLTRQAAAKIIACMMLGKTTAENLGNAAAPFKDVPAGHDFAGYISFCVEREIIDGYADGTFRPTGTLTGFAFLKMLLTALGYDSSIEGYTGTNWTVNVASRAIEVGLTDGNDEFVGTQPCNREQAALYAVNALQATLVEYESKGTNVSVNGATVAIGASKPTYVTSSIHDAATSIDDTIDNRQGDYTVEFAERYQPDLTLDDTTDDFGRPSHIWTWKNDEIGTYVNYDELVAEYTTKVTGDDLYDLLGKAALEKCEDAIYTYVDGETERSILNYNNLGYYFTGNQMAKNYNDGVGGTGNGVLTQVFHDTKDDEITVAVINTYLAKAAEDYDEKNDELDLDVYKIQDAGRHQYVKMSTEAVGPTSFTVSGEDFDIDEVTDGDLFLVTVADGAIQTMEAPEVLAGSTVSSFRVDKYVVSEGTQYDFASTAEYDVETLYDWTGHAAESNLKNLTYDIILDPFGYAIGVKLVEEPNQYLFLTGMDEQFSNLGSRNADANVIFADGKMDTVTVNLRNSRGLDANDFTVMGNGTLLNGYNDDYYGQLNTWCTYTVDSNGVYTLRRVPMSTADDPKVMQSIQNVTGTDTVELNKGSVALNGVGNGTGVFGRVYGNSETVYINVDNVTDMKLITGVSNRQQEIIDDVDSVTVGSQNVAIKVTNLTRSFAPANEIYTLHDDDGYIIAVVTIGEDQGSTTNYAYITGGVNQEAYGSDKDEWSWLRPAIVNGKAVELREVGDSLTQLYGLTAGNWYEVRYDADGNVRKVSTLNFPISTTDDLIDDVDEIQAVIDSKQEDTLLVWLNYCTYEGGNETNLSFKGNTLFIDTLGAATRGFSVSPDVNVVLALADKNHDPFDSVDDSYTGAAGLEKALRNLDTDATDVSGDGMLDYTLNGYLSFIMEDGVITSIVLNDYTGPRNNLVNAARPNVTPALGTNTPVSATVGQSVTLSVSVGASADGRDYGTLSYQWYKENGTTDIPVGTNSASYTYTPATAGTETFYCVVTNRDTSRGITGDVETRAASGNFDVTTGNQTMNVVVWLSADGTTKLPGVAPIMVPVSAMAGNAYTAMLDVSEIDLPDGYMLNDVDHYLTFNANTTMDELVKVYEAVDVDLPAGVSATWSIGGTSGSVTDGMAPKGSTVSLTLASGIGGYDAAGNAFDTSRTASADIDVAETEFGYFRVDLAFDANMAAYDDSAPAAMFLKPGEYDEFVTSSTGAWETETIEPSSNSFVTVEKTDGQDGGTATIRVTLSADAIADQSVTIKGDW